MNYELRICYDGTRYRGWQKQGNTSDTIQEKLEHALSRILGQTVEISGCGRTDAGVHARIQVCSFRAETEKSCEQILRELRSDLPQDIGALSLAPASPRFHARLSCREKTYVYCVWNSEMPQVFERKYRLAVPEPLDDDAMRMAAACLCGEHDFAAFCSLKNSKKSTVRNLKSIDIQRQGEELRFVYTGDGFLYNMVRILTGTLLQVGSGERDPAEIPAVLASLDRSKAGPLVPAHGLFLWEVRY